jgi:molecular chaperone GrpE
MTHHTKHDPRKDNHKEPEPAATVEISQEAIKSNDEPLSVEEKAAEEPQEVEKIAPSEDVNQGIIDDLLSQIADLNKQISELQKQVELEHDHYIRTMADFQNFRRRNEERNREAISFANSEILRSLLPIVDNFERAIASSEKNQQAFEALSNGVTLIMRQMQDFLSKNGVEPIESVGKVFDPNLHEAIVRVEDDEHAENTILDEIQKGYTIKGRVLRPAQVRVAVKK